jgi:hypothetical protein
LLNECLLRITRSEWRSKKWNLHVLGGIFTDFE